MPITGRKGEASAARQRHINRGVYFFHCFQARMKAAPTNIAAMPARA